MVRDDLMKMVRNDEMKMVHDESQAWLDIDW